MLIWGGARRPSAQDYVSVGTFVVLALAMLPRSVTAASAAPEVGGHFSPSPAASRALALSHDVPVRPGKLRSFAILQHGAHGLVDPTTLVAQVDGSKVALTPKEAFPPQSPYLLPDGGARPLTLAAQKSTQPQISPADKMGMKAAPMDTNPVDRAPQSSTSMSQMDEELPHPFFTHMGMPEAVGTYSLRTAALATRGLDGKTTGDFAFHFETGLTRNIGLHIRNDRFRANPSTEAMLQFAILRSKDGMNGVSALIEFEVPTNSKAENRVNTLVGFSSAYSTKRVAFNQVLHYNPRVDMIDSSVGVVFQASPKIFLVGEVLGTRMSDGTTIVSPVVGVKFRLTRGVVLGFGYMWPSTKARDFSSQYIFQPDFSW